ncbi:MAG: menaquinone via futalosine step 2 [Pseudanabaena frigida]|uniref:Menaquinone via futalosine step 2 n=1 Tax=Pseudanabaena frigida TaxID=945775 RepID=A0A2W4Y978_9CYAN|nr:MAG: menaquinone via futalosine step 2 [Pseudanabaena frigida]
MPSFNLKCIGAAALVSISLTVSQVNAQAKKVKHCLTECKPRLGIVSAFGQEADILLAETTNKQQYKINGNIFTTGNLRGNQVVIILTGVSVENAAMLTQLLIDHFNIHHLLLSGIAGGINPNYNIGDVVVPSKWASPLEVYWSNNSQIPAPCGKSGDLLCLGLQLSQFTNTVNSDYQFSSRGTGLFMRDTFVRNNSNFPDGEFKFDYKVDQEMFEVAKSINLTLDKCGPKIPNLCVSIQPKIRIGDRGASGSAFLANANYRSYLFKTIGAVSFDMETTAFAHVAYANEIPFIAFRSLSDLAGGDDSKDVGAFFGSGLAESNESKFTLSFLEAWAKRYPNGSN